MIVTNKILLLLGCSANFLAVANAQTELIENGSFEMSPTIPLPGTVDGFKIFEETFVPGWLGDSTWPVGAVEIQNLDFDAQDGSQWAELTTDGCTDSFNCGIHQVISGCTEDVTVSFYHRRREDDATETFAIEIYNADTNELLYRSSGLITPTNEWMEFTNVATDTANVDSLRVVFFSVDFNDAGDKGNLIDNVSVTCPASATVCDPACPSESPSMAPSISAAPSTSASPSAAPSTMSLGGKKGGLGGKKGGMSMGDNDMDGVRGGKKGRRM